MKTISLSVSESVYDEFRRAAKRRQRPIAQLIREAMEEYQAQHLQPRRRLLEFPVFAGRRLLGPLPSRAEIYDETFADPEREPS